MKKILVMMLALTLALGMVGLAHAEEGVIPCFETDGESMDVYIACR